MTDEQQPPPDGTIPPTPESEPQSVNEAPVGGEPPVAQGVSRRKVLLWSGAGVVGAAALGTGAVAFFASQNKNGTTQRDPGGQMPGGNRSGMPRGGRSGMPSGARPSGARTGGFPAGGPGGGPGNGASGMPTDMPTDQPS